MEYAQLGAIILAFLGGGGLGSFYFGGLWFTVRRLPYVQHPTLWMILSLVLRLVAMLAGFYFFFANHWQYILAALVGMLMIRILFVRRLRPKTEGITAPSSRGQQAQGKYELP